MNPQVTALLAAVLAALVPLIRAWVQANLTTTKLAHLPMLARIAVEAAEKLGTDTGADGPVKLNYASDVLVESAKRLGLKLSKDEVLAYIHSALSQVQRVTTP